LAASSKGTITIPQESRKRDPIGESEFFVGALRATTRILGMDMSATRMDGLTREESG